ncbi:molybdate ABC transporter permease [Ancylomarina euxinus]|uniref:Molybdenum transport system permease n=1 Tax=Ancylomarina euxinus TaxID=2283627 RepID=A0A425Y1P8_9BACT|nr:molybdate ABC transporter permease subunit [Ancylomarina euxinus]MCZ4695074.1 molybdate ABC transporter permease subunit [Ancylomarina euxinus]MUP14990.1 molybdate ABC transporter permease subunit [Ancylomarina euxinus]RRG21880.1 molybdate ABC transporter permease [Ancylomarina euxinus]
MTNYFELTSTEWEAISLSLQVAFWSALLCLPLAIFTGWFLARRQFKTKFLFEGFINLPLVLPPVATGFILLLLLGRNGLIGQFLNEMFGIKIAFSYYAAVIASMIVAFPLSVRSMRLSIEMIDPAYEEAARTLGADRWQSFFRITLPLALPGIISGFILAFARSLGEFGATIIFAGNIAGETQTLPLALYSAIQIPGQETTAFRLLIIAVIFSFIAMAGSELLVKNLHHRKHKA